MNHVLINHVDADGALALRLALALEKAGFPTRARKVQGQAEAATSITMVLADRVDLGGAPAARVPPRLRIDIARGAHASAPVLRLITEPDHDPAAAAAPANGDLSDVDGSGVALPLADGEVDAIRDRLVKELAARGAVAGSPRVERIAELERRIADGVRGSGEPAYVFQVEPVWWPSIILRTLYFAAIGLLLLNLDPFGASSSSAKYSQDLVNQVFGAWYPDDAREDSTVVLLTDQGLDGQNEPWPVSYRLHARVLNAILSYGPKAVMVDIWFHDARPDPTLGQLERALQRYRDSGIPVYVAASTEWDGGGIREEIAALATPVPVPKIGDEQDRANRQYPTFVTGAEGEPVETAALRIYREVGRPPIAPLPIGQPGKAYSEQDWRRAFGDPVEIVWGTTSAPVNEKSVYCAHERGPVEVVRARVLGGVPMKSDCPYAPTLLAGDLLTRSADADIAGLIEDKVVFYGAYVQGVSDIIDPPTHLPIAGVYLHPMALDNLTTFSDEYIRRAAPGGTRYVAARTADIVMLIAIAGVVVIFRNRAAIAARHPRIGRVLELRMTAGLMVGLPLALATTVGIVCFALLNLAPLNWIGHLSFAGTLAAYPYERHIAVMRRLGLGVFVPRRRVVGKRLVG